MGHGVDLNFDMRIFLVGKEERKNTCTMPWGRLTVAMMPDGNMVKLKYNEYDNIVLAEDDTRRVRFEHTPLGNIKSRTENGRTIRFEYDTEERLTAIRNESGEKYLFGRDAAGRLTQQTMLSHMKRKVRKTGKLHIIRKTPSFRNFYFDSGPIVNSNVPPAVIA